MSACMSTAQAGVAGLVCGTFPVNFHTKWSYEMSVCISIAQAHTKFASRSWGRSSSSSSSYSLFTQTSSYTNSFFRKTTFTPTSSYTRALLHTGPSTPTTPIQSQAPGPASSPKPGPQTPSEKDLLSCGGGVGKVPSVSPRDRIHTGLKCVEIHHHYSQLLLASQPPARGPAGCRRVLSC